MAQNRRWVIWSYQDLHTAIELRRRGKSYAAIGARLGGCHSETVRLRLKAHSIVTPSKSERRVSLNDLLNERDARLRARTLLSSVSQFFGDPPPNYSALDGKVGMT